MHKKTENYKIYGNCNIVTLKLYDGEQFQVNVHSHFKFCMACGYIYRVSQEECAVLRESVPYVKLYRYNPKHLYPKSNGYGDNGQRSLKL